MTAELLHTFTRKEILQAEHDFTEAIEKYFGEVWRIPSDGEYVGVSWDCRSPIAIHGGLWRLCQAAIHRGAVRAAGKIETREVQTLLRFVIFFNKKEEEKPESRIIT